MRSRGASLLLTRQSWFPILLLFMKHLLPPRLSASFLYLSLLFLLSDCRKDLPKREFPKCETAISSVSHQATQLSVEFTVSSANNATFDKIEWDFGDGKKDSGPSLKVTHKYEAKGTYTVKLSLTDKCGNVTANQYELTVSDAVIPTLEACSAEPANTSVTFKFKLANDGKAAITSWTVYYSETNPEPGPDTQDPHGDPQPGEKMPVTGETKSLVIGNLKEATKYYYRIYVTNSAGSQKCGSDVTTLADAIVETVAASSVGDNSATLGATLTKASYPAVSEMGVYVSTSQDPNASNTISGFSTSTVPGLGTPWNKGLNVFQYGTLYYYRAYARYNGKEVVGKTKRFVAANISSNLMANYPFDDNTARDVTNNNPGSTTKVTPTFDEGRFGQGMKFNANQYLELPDQTFLRQNRLSISLWVKTGIVDSWMQLYSKSNFADGKGEQYSANIKLPLANQNGNTVINADFKQESGCQAGVGWKNLPGAFNYQPQTWVHVVAVYNGNKANLYINGDEYYSLSMPTAELDQCGLVPLRFGAENMTVKEGGTRYLNGMMDEIRIYNIALSPQQVKALYNYQ